MKKIKIGQIGIGHNHGEKENPYSYEHELAVQKTLCRVVGEN
jgi:hypothetical protein